MLPVQAADDSTPLHDTLAAMATLALRARLPGEIVSGRADALLALLWIVECFERFAYSHLSSGQTRIMKGIHALTLSESMQACTNTNSPPAYTSIIACASYAASKAKPCAACESEIMRRMQPAAVAPEPRAADVPACASTPVSIAVASGDLAGASAGLAGAPANLAAHHHCQMWLEPASAGGKSCLFFWRLGDSDHR